MSHGGEDFDHPKPAAVGPSGEWFTFEKGAAKHGDDGRADVWKRGYFGWEYKRRRKDFDAAHDQLSKYREALENPPLLETSRPGVGLPRAELRPCGQGGRPCPSTGCPSD